MAVRPAWPSAAGKKYLLESYLELVWGIEEMHRTDGLPVSGETVSTVIHQFFTGYFTNFVSKFENEFHR